MVSKPLPGVLRLSALLAFAFGAPQAPAQERFVRGDANQDLEIDASDAIFILGHLFLGEVPVLDCADAADVDDDGELSISDPIALLSFLFLGGAPPSSPFPACGFDPAAPERLGCERSPNCPAACSHPSAPGLCALEAPADLLCPGQTVVLAGINFDPDFRKHRIRFRGGAGFLSGVPLRVNFPPDRDPRDGRDSRLEVLVPAGLVSGALELEVNGAPAGDLRYRACPALLGSGIGPSVHEPRLIHAWPAGFLPPFTVTLFGLNLDGVTEAVLSDRFGVEVRVPRERFLGSPLSLENGLDHLQIALSAVSGLSFHERSELLRDNLTVAVARGAQRSNSIQVPVAIYPARSGLGAVVNGIAVPSGVRSGPIRLQYCLYDHPLINQAYAMEVQWTADGGATWFPALPDASDPLNDGARQVLPGDIDFGPPAGLFYAGGALRTFVWNSPRDPNLKDLVENVARDGVPTALAIRFRIHPVPESAVSEKPGDSGHFIESPPIAYLALPAGGAGEPTPAPAGELVESFTTTELSDPGCTTASWGPPGNPGELRGTLPEGQAAPPALEFGEGVFDLVLGPLEPPPPELRLLVYLADTSRMRILRFADVGGVLETVQLFPSPGAPNPGEEAFEFHLRTLTVGKSIEVHVEGSRPAVFRVSGKGLSEEDPSVRIDGTLDVSGEPGEGMEGMGGRGGAGGGQGGRGAKLQLDSTGQITRLSQFQPGLIPAGSGGNLGGGGGATAGALDPVPQTISKLRGGSGGGGGHRLVGSPGDPGAFKNAPPFSPPRGGRGGPDRGSESLVPLTPGSGGGGGGASLSRPAGALTHSAVPGAGGGGGGGALQITAHGSMAIAGRILVNGGKGGDSGEAGAGGGGSGGAILLQASGAIEVGCENLEAQGGARGQTFGANPSGPDAGNGSPGRIRIEAGRGGAPICRPLAEASELALPLDSSTAPARSITLEDASRFPPRGVVRIDEEIIAYRKKGLNSLLDLTRGLRGTKVAAHGGPPAAAVVVLESAVFPPEGMVEVIREGQESGKSEEILESPGPIDSGTGADGTLHAYFIETIDPATGNPPVDPETGEPRSVWSIDTDAGTIRDARGAIILTSAAAGADPGLFSLESLRIDGGVVLRAWGTRPLRILVKESAEIDGTIEVSGEDGGSLEFDAGGPAAPRRGGGGSPGCGGGRGGNGATLVFRDGDLENKSPANIVVESAKHGGLPAAFPAEFDRTGSTSGAVPPPEDLTGLETTRSTPGDSLLVDPLQCGIVDAPCTAGGGGGGGGRRAGSDGQSRPAGSQAFGRGGSRLGLDEFRQGPAFLFLGGEGGAGGGASAHVSAEYRSGNAGESLFKAAARFAPGTGGGGGGGVLHLAVGETLLLGSGGAILARGGGARQSIDLGGNGGGGGGGSVLIQAKKAMEIQPGARIDVRGGKGNLPPPVPAGGPLPFYEGNAREGTADPWRLAGAGGDGAPGRVRIEAPAGSGLLRGGFNESVSSAALQPGAHWSVGCSRTIRLGAGPGEGATGHLWRFDRPILTFAPNGLPAGTGAFIIWKGADPSLDLHGTPGPPGAGPLPVGIGDRQDVRDLEFIQFEVWLLSNSLTGKTPALQELRLRFEQGH
jgi:hypothetical protein